MGELARPGTVRVDLHQAAKLTGLLVPDGFDLRQMLHVGSTLTSGPNDEVAYRADAKKERSMLDEATSTAGDLMTRDLAVVHPEASLLEAVKLMARRKISGMPVVDNAGVIVGMISEGDLVRWHEGYSGRQAGWLDMLAEGTDLAPAFLKEIQDQNRKVKSIIAAGATTVTEDTVARNIALLLHTKHIKRVPVVRDGKQVGNRGAV